MKKYIIFLLVLFITFVGNVTLATNWMEIDNKTYIDMDSVNIELAPLTNSKIISFWVKSLNNKSSYYLTLEKKYKQKIWFDKTRFKIDIDSRKISIDYWIVYDLNGMPIISQNYIDDWSPIIPDTFSDLLYNIAQIICTKSN